jgi:hypothetical protein
MNSGYSNLIVGCNIKEDSILAEDLESIAKFEQEQEQVELVDWQLGYFADNNFGEQQLQPTRLDIIYSELDDWKYLECEK